MKKSYFQFGRVLIILLMLFMQSASLAHAIEHQDEEHTEHCAAFVTADQSVNTVDEFTLADLPVKFVVQFQCQLPPFAVVKRLSKLSRAPPHII